VKVADDGLLALRYLAAQRGVAMANTREFASILSDLERLDLVYQDRGGPTDPHFMGTNVYRLSANGKKLAEAKA